MTGDLIAICALGTVAVGVVWALLNRQAGIDKAKRAQAEQAARVKDAQLNVTPARTVHDLAQRVRDAGGH